VARLNEIWTPRHQDALRRVFNMRGTAPSPQLAPEIQPVIVLHGSPIEDEPELGMLHGDYPIIARVSAAAVAAQFSFANINLLSGTGFLFVVQTILSDSVSFIQLAGGNQGGAPAGSNVQGRDHRIFNSAPAGAPTSALQATQGSNAALPANLCHNLPPNLPLRIQCILGSTGGGSSIAVWGSVVNSGLVMSIIGYMRKFETSDGF